MDSPEKKDPVSILFKAVALTLLTIGGWLILTDEMEGKQGDIYREQAENFIFELRPIAASELPALVANEKRATLLMVHASWCSTCKVLLPDVLALKAAKKTTLNVELISLDTQSYALARSIVKQGYEGKFTPYMLRPSELPAFEQTLEQLGGHFSGGIPYFALFDANGKLLKDGVGGTDFEAIVTAAQAL